MNAHEQGETLLDQVVRLQDLLVSFATGGGASNSDYEQLRSQLIHNTAVRDKLPALVRQCRDLSQFWAIIKQAHDTYKVRRTFLWEAFGPLIDELEFVGRSSATIHGQLSRHHP